MVMHNERIICIELEVTMSHVKVIEKNKQILAFAS